MALRKLKSNILNLNQLFVEYENQYKRLREEVGKISKVEKTSLNDRVKVNRQETYLHVARCLSNCHL